LTPFIDLLFHGASHLLKDGLSGLREVLAASTIMYFPQVVKDFGDQHLLVSFVMDAARTAGVTYELIASWSKAIYLDWINRNGFSFSAEDAAVSQLIKLQSELISSQYQEIQMLKSETRILSSKVCLLEGKIDRMIMLVEGTIVNNAAFSPQKKRKIDEVSEGSNDKEIETVGMDITQQKEIASVRNDAVSDQEAAAPVVVEMSNVYVGKYRLESLKGITLAEIFCAYYVHNLSVEVNLETNVTLRSKFNTAIRFILRFVSDSIAREINGLKPFKTLSDRSRLQEIAKDVSAAAMAYLADRENISGPSRHLPNVEGVLKRLNNLQKSSNTKSAVKKGPMDSFIITDMEEKRENHDVEADVEAPPSGMGENCENDVE
jgi:hypothetical protein